MESKSLLENSNLNFDGKINMNSSELKHPYIARDLAYEFKIYPKVRFLTGSIHKSINKLDGKGSHNANDLIYSDFCNEIDRMFVDYGIDPVRAKIQNLEFGINFIVNESPSTIIRENIIAWDKYPINRNLEFQGAGKFYEWTKSQFKVKLYDKSNQYGIDTHIMRIEKKIIKSESINRLGIQVLRDLKDQRILSVLANELLKTYDQLIFIDDFDSSRLEGKEKTVWSKMINPKYWELYSSKSKTAKERQQYKRDKTKFYSIIERFNLGQQKDKYRKRILSKIRKFQNVTE